MAATCFYSHCEKERVIFQHPVVDVHEFLHKKCFYLLTPVKNNANLSLLFGLGMDILLPRGILWLKEPESNSFASLKSFKP